MKPLNPQRQPPVSLVGGELDKKSSEIIVEMNEKTKVSIFFLSRGRVFSSRYQNKVLCHLCVSYLMCPCR